MPFVIENLTQYDLTDREADTLISMGFLFRSDHSENKEELETTALCWDQLGLVGDKVFDLFDAILKRGERI